MAQGAETMRNLWNVDKVSNSKKTKTVIKFIEELEPPEGFDSKDRAQFHATKKNALNALTANNMLVIIGYDIKGNHKIFDSKEKKYD